jgi:bifunctional non-homologous end joining protein LigD
VKKDLKLSNLNKVFWPKEKITKGDVINYYEKIAPYILPYLKNRPESLNRHPNGIKGPSFYQKDVGSMPPKWVRVEKIYSKANRKKITYLICEDKETLLYLANLGCIEINPWNSSLPNLDNPDWMILDLDPEGVTFDKVVETALAIHKLLDSIGVTNVCKTSGKSGLHVYVPMGAKYDTEQVKQFANLIAIFVNRQLPSITSVERRLKNRQHKVYLDYLQNNKGQTLAAPYSLRPAPGATVATPLEWKEVKKGLDPKKFNIKTIFPRLKQKGDLFKPVLGKATNLKAALKRLEKIA